MAQIGDMGTEQYTVITRVDDELIRKQAVHDPFATTSVTLKGWRHAWNILRRGIKVQVSIDGSHGAICAVMALDPRKLEEDTQLFLEQQAQRRAGNDANGVTGYYAASVNSQPQQAQPQEGKRKEQRQ